MSAAVDPYAHGRCNTISSSTKTRCEKNKTLWFGDVIRTKNAPPVFLCGIHARQLRKGKTLMVLVCGELHCLSMHEGNATLIQAAARQARAQASEGETANG